MMLENTHHFASPSWWQLSGNRQSSIETLQGDCSVDVAIVGGGLTGLWTAYYLKRQRPSLNVCILEKDRVGAGASGRNGGWCSGDMVASHGDHEKRQSGSALRMAKALQQTVDEVGRVSSDLGIDCHFKKGGIFRPAMNRGQMKRLEQVVVEDRVIGLNESDSVLLSANEAQEHARIPGMIGGFYTPHCAAIHPYRLVVGLVDSLKAMGVKIFEDTCITSCENGVAYSLQGKVKADYVVMAVEGYSSSINSERQRLIPIENYMIVTEQISEEQWQHIGLEHRQVFEDGRRMIYYGQRTADDRIAIGGLSAPYRFRSRIEPNSWQSNPIHERLHQEVRSLFPILKDIKVAHRWGGVLGAPRDLYPSVGIDRSRRYAWAGGYVGQGVSTTNLAARSLADLILETPSHLTELPWINHRSPKWEPEPLRWLGAKAVGASMRLFDWMDSNVLR